MDPAQRKRWIQLGVLGVILLVVVQFVLIPSLESIYPAWVSDTSRDDVVRLACSTPRPCAIQSFEDYLANRAVLTEILGQQLSARGVRVISLRPEFGRRARTGELLFNPFEPVGQFPELHHDRGRIDVLAYRVQPRQHALHVSI